MPAESKVIKDAAATPWSAASFCMERGERTLLFDDQSGSAGGSSSILLCEPERWLVEADGKFVEGPTGRPVSDPIAWMRYHHRPAGKTSAKPFVGGIAGVLGFEFGWFLDELNTEARADKTPGLWVGVFPAAAVYETDRKQWSVVGRTSSAIERLAERIKCAPREAICGDQGVGRRLAGDVDSARYAAQVESAVDAIYAGEFFEVNYTERFRGRWSGDRRHLHDQLRRRAPGDFGVVLDIPELFLASVSPEQFLRVDNSGHIVTRPIKGTRQRGENPGQDRRLAEELVNSEKDRAENVMIVDLMRNDLTRVCKPGSVRATELCKLHSFASVHHLVSQVEGQLSDSFSALDAFLAAFPAGSITGAPKLRSMEWIATHEKSARGPYTGSAFYWSDCGRLDSNVLIRTAVVADDEVAFGSGGAVVADSDPEGEYEEALWKAAPFIALMED